MTEEKWAPNRTPNQLENKSRMETGYPEDFVGGYNPARNLQSPVSYRRGAPRIRIWNHMVYANTNGLAELTGVNPSTVSDKARRRGIRPSRIKFPFGTGKGNSYYALTPEFLTSMNIDPALVTDWRRENDPKFKEPSSV